MNQTPLNPVDEERLKKALEQSANGQVVSRGSFAQYAQPPLNPDALEAAARATYELRNPESWARSWEELGPEEREEEWIKPARTAAAAYIAVAQPVVDYEPDAGALRKAIEAVHNETYGAHGDLAVIAVNAYVHELTRQEDTK